MRHRSRLTGAVAATLLVLGGTGILAATTTAGASVGTAATVLDETASAQRSTVGTRATRKLRLSLLVNPKGAVSYGTKVTVRAVTLDQKGKAIKGVKVRFKWTMTSHVSTTDRMSDAKGTAISSRTMIDDGPYVCSVQVRASYMGQVRSQTARFQVYGSC